MSRKGLLACCGLLVFAAAAAAAGWSALPTGVSVQLTVTTYTQYPTVDQVQIYTLTCDPVGGTMPLAYRICDDIDQHPAAMLTPRQVGQRTVCGGTPNEPTVSVSATANGVNNGFGPMCDNPGGVAANIYEAAARNDERALDLLEPQLVCDEDPKLYLQPTSPSIWACSEGLWTPHAAQMIRTAEGNTQIAALRPANLFPSRIGVQTCALPIGGQPGGRIVDGECGVLENEQGSTSVVTFVEYWGAGELAPVLTQDKHNFDHNFLTNLTATRDYGNRHNWRLVIRNNKVVAVSQSGAVPPQLQH